MCNVVIDLSFALCKSDSAFYQNVVLSNLFVLKWKSKSLKLSLKLKNETRVNTNLKYLKMKFNPMTNDSIWKKIRESTKTFKSLGLDKTSNKHGFILFNEKLFILEANNDISPHTAIISCVCHSPRFQLSPKVSMYLERFKDNSGLFWQIISWNSHHSWN